MRALENEQTRRRMLGYSPRYDSNIGLWVCADSCVESGGLVSQLNDLSGYGRHFTQSVDSYKPTLIRNARNGHAAIQADGTNDSMNTVALSLAQPLHYFFAVSWTVLTLGSNRYLTDGFPTLNTGDIFQASGVATASTYFGASGPSAAFTSGAWCIIEVVANGASSKIAINGGAQTTGNAGTANPGGITLFTSATRLGPNFASALLGEFALYTAEKTGSDRTKIINYMKGRYGIA